jgi:cytoskeletal protein CcmA (bactofilin family)
MPHAIGVMKFTDLEAAAARLMSGGERRVEQRVAVDVPVQAVISHPQGLSARLCEAVVEDLTPSAASLRTTGPLKKGWLVKMHVPIGSTKVEVRGRIVRRRTVTTEAGVRHLHRVELTAFDPSALQPVVEPSDPPNSTIDLQCREEPMTPRNSFTLGDPRTATANSLLAVLGASARIEGRFEIEESIEVQCEIAGDMQVGGTVTIGERGVVSADISTVNAIIRGRYDGDLKATGSVEIAVTAQVSGTIEASEIAIARGAVFTGSIKHIEAAIAATAVQAQTASVASQTPVVFETERQVPVSRLPLADVANTRDQGPEFDSLNPQELLNAQGRPLA